MKENVKVIKKNMINNIKKLIKIKLKNTKKNMIKNTERKIKKKLKNIKWNGTHKELLVNVVEHIV